MADFMTVLAASQKQTHSATQGKALAALLPGGLFESVLSAQIETAGEAMLLPTSLSLALSDEITLPVQPAAKKSVLAAAADTDKNAMRDSLAPMFVNNSMDTSKPAPESAPGDRVSRISLERAASPAASGVSQGQDLPLPASLRPASPTQLAQSTQSAPAKLALDPQIATLPEVAEALLSQATVSAPVEGAMPVDQSAVAAARQLVQFEQRVPEARVQVAVEAPVRSQGFPAEFSEKIVWLAGRQSQVADLTLSPPQLGSLEVRLSLSGSEAGAQFYSPHPLVRDAIEAALPRLRELMAQAGIALGDAQVRDEAFARREAGGSVRAGGEPSSDAAAASLAPAGNGAARGGSGLVDLYV